MKLHVIRWTVGARRWWSWSLTGGVRREGEIAFPFSFHQHPIRHHHRRLWRRAKAEVRIVIAVVRRSRVRLSAFGRLEFEIDRPFSKMLT